MAGPWEDFQTQPDDGPWTAFQGADFQGPEQPDIGRTRAAIKGAAQGISGNFADEITGLQGAIARWIYEKLSGESPGEAGKYYEKFRDQSRAESKTAERQYPGTSLASNVAGAVGLPVGGMLGVATLPGRMGRGAAVGGAYGGASGVGGGETLDERLSGGLSGLAVGAGVGAVAPPLVEGAIQGARALGRPIASLARGAVSPETEAARRVVGSIERDIGIDPAAAARMTPAEMMANRGQGATVMDMGGERTRALARSAANTSPEGRRVLSETIDDRFEGQSGRLSDWVRGAFNFPDAEATQAALQRVGRTTSRANYGRAYQEGAEGIWTPTLERLAGSRAVSEAMRRASQNAGDEAIVSGYGAMNPRVTFSPDGRIQFNRGPNGMPTYPDLQFWDLTRRELSDAAQRAGRGTSEARRLENFARAMNEELDRAVPSYNVARQGYAQFRGATNALEAGQNFVGAGERIGFRQAQTEIARMTPVERQLFQDGYVSRFIEAIERTPDRRNVLDRIARSGPARQELEIALGPQRWRELEARLRLERIMDTARGAVQGNSTTARQIAELGLAGGVGGVGIYNLDPTALSVAAFIAGRRHINDRVSRRVAEMLTSRDPTVLAQGVRIVARNNNFMERLRRLDGRIGQVGGQQGTGAVPVQLPMAGRADDEQQ
jgi:hypothetical protein